MTRGPRLSDHLSALAATASDRLGAGIVFTPSGGTAQSLRALINYREIGNSLGGIEAIAQSMQVSIAVGDLTARPDRNCRIVLAQFPAKTFQPANITLDDDGLFWEFDLKEIKNG